MSRFLWFTVYITRQNEDAEWPRTICQLRKRRLAATRWESSKRRSTKLWKWILINNGWPDGQRMERRQPDGRTDSLKSWCSLPTIVGIRIPQNGFVEISFRVTKQQKNCKADSEKAFDNMLAALTYFTSVTQGQTGR